MGTPFHRRWPNDQVFVAENVKLLYLPIAKNGCSTLKRLMVELSDLPDRDRLLAGDIHQTTDRSRSGIQLKDREEAAARALLADPGYFRFVVLREPIDRLVSAYLEKFVLNRRDPGNMATIRPALAAAQGVAPEAVDFERSASFRAFAEFVLAEPRHRLDPHWRPQSDYLAEIPMAHRYTMADLDLLAADLGARLGRPVAIGHANRSREAARAERPGAADLLPADLEGEARRLSAESFADPALLPRLEALYALDLTLFAAVAAETAARRAAAAPAPVPPAPLPLRKRLSLNGLRRALGLAPVARPGLRGG